jgi:hypothetical protein
MMKTTLTADGQTLYGPRFINYDDLLFLHACSLSDPRCDQAHFGPHFMTFHRALLLKVERSLLAIDSDIEAMPYWDYAKDTNTGVYFQTGNFIFSNDYFGDYAGDPKQNYAVTNGLFAYWPIAEFTEERFGESSSLDVLCARQKYFTGFTASVCERCCGQSDCTCDPETDTSKTWFRAHDDCTPYVTRNPFEEPNFEGVCKYLQT